MITSHDCPKFDRCSAGVCPLDKTAGSHLTGEPVCFYLREFVKDGGEARLRRSLPGVMVDEIANELPAIISRYGDIKRKLERAAKTGSKSEIRAATTVITEEAA